VIATEYIYTYLDRGSSTIYIFLKGTERKKGTEKRRKEEIERIKGRQYKE